MTSSKLPLPRLLLATVLATTALASLFNWAVARAVFSFSSSGFCFLVHPVNTTSKAITTNQYLEESIFMAIFLRKFDECQLKPVG